jgi:spore coat protein JC
MWTYERHLEYPVNITKTNAELAKVILTQFGGPDGELGASTRYLAQRYSNTNRKVVGVLTDIGVSVPKLHLLFFDNLHVNNIRCVAFIPTM